MHSHRLPELAVKTMVRKRLCPCSPTTSDVSRDTLGTTNLLTSASRKIAIRSWRLTQGPVHPKAGHLSAEHGKRRGAHLATLEAGHRAALARRQGNRIEERLQGRPLADVARAGAHGERRDQVGAVSGGQSQAVRAAGLRLPREVTPSTAATTSDRVAGSGIAATS